MLREVIKFEDFEGQEKEKVVYFNLTKAEIMQLEFENGGDLRVRIQRLSETENAEEVHKIFKGILKAAYGVKTADGGWIKPEGAFEEFSHSEAYSELIMGFLTNPGKMAHFIAGLVSGAGKKLTAEDVQAEIDKGLKERGFASGQQNVFEKAEEAPAYTGRSDGNPDTGRAFDSPPSTGFGPPSTGPRPPVRPQG